jgi:hypothetical protein
LDTDEPSRGVSVVELGLLARMRAADKLSVALSLSGLGQADLDRASRQWDLGARRAINDYRRELGAELAVEPEAGPAAGTAYAGSLRYRFATALWPSFDLLIREHPSGFTWGSELVRAVGSAPPAVNRITELAPWSMTDADVKKRFGPHDSEVDWEHGKDAFRTVDGCQLVLEFDFGLLQAVMPYCP